MMRTTAKLVPLAAIALIALAACGGGVKSNNTSSAGTSSVTTGHGQTTPPGNATQTTSTGSAQASNTSTSATAAQTAPLAQETVKESCSPGATVRISILGLRVHGQLATLELGMTPNDPSKSGSDQTSLSGASCAEMGNADVWLLDPVGLKRYTVVQDSAHNYLAPGDLWAVNGQMATGDWMFAAPPATVTSVDVQVGQWPTFNNVPVQR